ncbi:thioredoxin-dependent thiol peroxidase [Aureibacillus halotolerans]|uniref:thioredoxin-dependent peroxiredoxin n=1 Tax=Aureibacillus halotolerans TaxID=1508390 RepID=A0A4R6TPF6_9BACI|nr:thioredoxin-dependent thiol peroxidase [Aureibacillus halotolerans]TDQ33738.1 peroxiredoxin Q/BCP [Aureibacillus halotolerans]
MSIAEGQSAPDFTLPSQKGEKIQLSSFTGKYVVLYFYPKDMTPGCTTQACDFRDHFQSFADANAVIIGISPDPVKRHQTFVEKYDLPFCLLADEDHQVAEDYGVWQLKKNFGNEYMGIVRSTFVIDPEGTILKEWRNVRVKGHVEKALQFVQNQGKSK